MTELTPLSASLFIDSQTRATAKAIKTQNQLLASSGVGPYRAGPSGGSDPKKVALQKAQQAMLQDLGRVLQILGVSKNEVDQLVKGFGKILNSKTSELLTSTTGTDGKTTTDISKSDRTKATTGNLVDLPVEQAPSSEENTAPLTLSNDPGPPLPPGMSLSLTRYAAEQQQDLSVDVKNSKMGFVGSFRGHSLQIMMGDDVDVTMSQSEKIMADQITTTSQGTVRQSLVTTQNQTLHANGGIYIQLDGGSKEDVEALIANLTVHGMKGNNTAVIATPGGDFNGAVTVSRIKDEDTALGPGAVGFTLNLQAPVHQMGSDGVMA